MRGPGVLCDLADELGLTAGLSEAMAPTKKRRRGHDRGQVLVDMAVAIAGWGDHVFAICVLLRAQPELFGEVWRRFRLPGGPSVDRSMAAPSGASRRQRA